MVTQTEYAKIDALSTALSMRALQAAGCDVNRALPPSERHPGYEDFGGGRLIDVARTSLELSGVRTAGMPATEIAMAVFNPNNLGARAAGHVTASFPQLTLDAANKSLRAGYEETRSVWLGPMRQGTSAPDFKDVSRIQLGGISNLPTWQDNSPHAQASMADERVNYAVEARSMRIDFSYQLLLNDDLDAISRMPQMLGAAAKRTVNALAWQALTSNPTMPDGQALFLAAAAGNRFRANSTTGAGEPSVTTVGTLTNLMRQMRGMNTPENNEGSDILNLSPSFLVVPGALDIAARQLVQSTADPAANLSSAVANTTSHLQVVTEPLLDVDSATRWYLFTSPNLVDTVEVTFLQGQEAPMTISGTDEKLLSQWFIVIQTCAAQAIDFRGIQRHDGI